MLFRNIFQNRINVLALLCFLSITGITLFKNAVELEDAEQAYYSQWLRWGYDDQPPLYTWLQYGINTVFGVHKVSFSLLRGCIFSSVLLLLYRFSKAHIKEEGKAQLSVYLLVLVPVFIDFAFRRLSHTTLLCFSIIASYYMIQRLLTRKTFLNYMLFGCIVSVGVLSKYNYVLFLGAFLITCLFHSGLRAILIHRYTLLAMLIIGLLVTLHLYWLLGPEGHLEELRQSIDQKVRDSDRDAVFWLSPLLSFLWSFVKLVTPLFGFMLVLFLLKKLRFKKSKLDWLGMMFWSQWIVLALFFMGMDIQKVEVRWLLPLFISFPVVLFKVVEFQSIKKWVSIGFISFVTVVLVQILRTSGEKLLGITSSVHFGFETLASKLRANYDERQWILPNVTYGGNIRLLHPNTELFSSDDFSLPNGSLSNSSGIGVIIGKENLEGKTSLDSITDFGKEKERLYFVETKELKNRSPK